MRKILLFLVAVTLAAGGYYAWREGIGLETPVRTAAIRRGTAAEVVYATGIVEPERWAKVVSLQRKRIVWVCDCEGKPVKQGDILVRLDDFEERAALTELEARRKRISLDIGRVGRLVARSAATQTSLEQLQTQLQEYDARIAAQKDRIRDLALRAPLDGVVLRKDAEVGEIAGTGANDILFWVGPPKPLRIVADVSEDDIPRVKSGQRVLLRNEGFKNADIEARVGDITPKGDPATKTFRVYLTLPDDTPLRIGMSVEANIVTQAKEGVLLVPSEAIASGHVFVVRENVLKQTPVRTGIRGTRMIEVVEGLDEGARIVAPATAKLKDGMRVRVEGDAEPPAGKAGGQKAAAQ
ncbi:MAG: efflux RND transporter periplasmic adaptor subunit [Beijerinckiaceae bacterium]